LVLRARYAISLHFERLLYFALINKAQAVKNTSLAWAEVV